jgi:predicted site-specific integrase-resolvase
VAQVVNEIASGAGVTDRRPKLLALLTDTRVTRIVVERRDRLTRFGCPSLEALLQAQGRIIEVVNLAENEQEDDKEDLLADLVAIISSFTTQLYGQRRAKRTTERIAAALRAEELREEEADADVTR